MLRKSVLPLILFAVLILAAVFMPKNDEKNICRQFLSVYGYETAETVETEMVTLPTEKDEVWTEYLALQRKNGFDMEPYKGKQVLKFVFRVTNYPSPDTVYANVFWADGNIIGGDIMSPALNGFMHGLRTVTK